MSEKHAEIPELDTSKKYSEMDSDQRAALRKKIFAKVEANNLRRRAKNWGVDLTGDMADKAGEIRSDPDWTPRNGF